MRESEKEMATILDSTSELIVHQDGEHRVVWANNVAANSVGKSPEALKGLEERVNQLNEILMLLNKTLRHDILNDLTVVRNSMEMYDELGDKKLLDNAFNSTDDSVNLISKIKRLEVNKDVVRSE